MQLKMGEIGEYCENKANDFRHFPPFTIKCSKVSLNTHNIRLNMREVL